ncbi:hypothetical protein MA9V1_143 [Chryseobacterium phage MA9V-1]|nr:hypothetical protein MA9V1_143 [Chryseobacterium phage MA9V-1]
MALTELQSCENLTTDSNGNIVFNASFRMNIDDIKVVDTFTVDDMTEHRPQLISQSMFQTQNYADLICIFNQINNPFYIPKGTILKIPDLAHIQSKMLLFSQQNIAFATENVIQENVLTKKATKSSNVQRSEGRLIFRKQN